MTTCINWGRNPDHKRNSVNPGGLKTGDGTVVLNQRADTAGNVQAFSSVNLASGRPTVVLGDARQVNRITFHEDTGR